MNKKLFIFKAILAVILIAPNMYSHIVRSIVLEHPETGKQVILYGDFHLISNKAQNDYIRFKMGELKRLINIGAKTKIYYENPGEINFDAFKTIDQLGALPVISYLDKSHSLGLIPFDPRLSFVTFGLYLMQRTPIDDPSFDFKQPSFSNEQIREQLVQVVKQNPLDQKYHDKSIVELFTILYGLFQSALAIHEKNVLSLAGLDSYSEFKTCLLNNLEQMNNITANYNKIMENIQNNKLSSADVLIFTDNLLAQFGIFDFGFINEINAKTATQKSILFSGFAHTKMIAQYLLLCGYIKKFDSFDNAPEDLKQTIDSIGGISSLDSFQPILTKLTSFQVDNADFDYITKS